MIQNIVNLFSLNLFLTPKETKFEELYSIFSVLGKKTRRNNSDNNKIISQAFHWRNCNIIKLKIGNAIVVFSFSGNYKKANLESMDGKPAKLQSLFNISILISSLNKRTTSFHHLLYSLCEGFDFRKLSIQNDSNNIHNNKSFNVYTEDKEPHPHGITGPLL